MKITLSKDKAKLEKLKSVSQCPRIAKIMALVILVVMIRWFSGWKG